MNYFRKSQNAQNFQITTKYKVFRYAIYTICNTCKLKGWIYARQMHRSSSIIYDRSPI